MSFAYTDGIYGSVVCSFGTMLRYAAKLATIVDKFFHSTLATRYIAFKMEFLSEEIKKSDSKRSMKYVFHYTFHLH